MARQSTARSHINARFFNRPQYITWVLLPPLLHAQEELALIQEPAERDCGGEHERRNCKVTQAVHLTVQPVFDFAAENAIGESAQIGDMNEHVDGDGIRSDPKERGRPSLALSNVDDVVKKAEEDRAEAAGDQNEGR